VHNRTQFAVEAQLERQGLWDRAERRPTTPGGGRSHDMMQQPPSSAMGAAVGEPMIAAGASQPIPFDTDRD